MPHILSPEAEAAFAAGLIAPVVLVDFYLATSEGDPLTLRMSSREFDLTFAANDGIDGTDAVAYSPMFQRMNVDLSVRQAIGFASQPITITLDGSRAGDDEDLTGLFADADWHQRPMRVRLIVVNVETLATPSAPEYEWRGRLDHRDFRRQPDQPSRIVITAQGGIFRVRGANRRLRTHEDQQRRLAGDMFFSGTARMVAAGIVWGKNPNRPLVTTGGGGTSNTGGWGPRDNFLDSP